MAMGSRPAAFNQKREIKLSGLDLINDSNHAGNKFLRRVIAVHRSKLREIKKQSVTCPRNENRNTSIDQGIR